MIPLRVSDDIDKTVGRDGPGGGGDGPGGGGDGYGGGGGGGRDDDFAN